MYVADNMGLMNAKRSFQLYQKKLLIYIDAYYLVHERGDYYVKRDWKPEMALLNDDFEL